MIPEAERLRVVIYARVSTEHEAQMYALENQLEWYRQVLSQKPEWNLVGDSVNLFSQIRFPPGGRQLAGHQSADWWNCSTSISNR